MRACRHSSAAIAIAVAHLRSSIYALSPFPFAALDGLRLAHVCRYAQLESGQFTQSRRPSFTESHSNLLLVATTKFECDSVKCRDWDCAQWCRCFDEHEETLYTKAGCDQLDDAPCACE